MTVNEKAYQKLVRIVMSYKHSEIIYIKNIKYEFLLNTCIYKEK